MDDKQLEQEIYVQKQTAFYQTMLNSWVENRMEKDKQILTLSSLAIGLLMYFYDRLTELSELFLWIFSGTAFVVAIIIIIFIFQTNAKYIEHILNENENKNAVNISLRKMTITAFIFFLVGIISSFILVINMTNFTIIKTERDRSMTDSQNIIRGVEKRDGLNGIQDLKPKLSTTEQLKKGLEDAGTLKPQPPADTSKPDKKD